MTTDILEMQFYQRMGLFIQENGPTARNLEREFKFGRTDLYTKVIGPKIWLMVEDVYIIVMVIYMMGYILFIKKIKLKQEWEDHKQKGNGKYLHADGA